MVTLSEIQHALKHYSLHNILKHSFSWIIADTYVVSFRKSGRTWLRVMLARAIAQQYHLPKMRLDTQYMTLFTLAPNIVFSHGGSNRHDNRINFRTLLKTKKIILLARDPRDDIVSLYHDYNERHKKCDLTISQFIRHEKYGIAKTIQYMNQWAETMQQRKSSALLVRYEDMKTNAALELQRVLDFLQIAHTPQLIKEAVEFGSFENMRKMELANQFNDERLQTKNKSNVNAFKTRKGKTGTYLEELSHEDIQFVNQQIREKLHPLFEYK